MKLYKTITPQPLKKEYEEFQKHKPIVKGELLTFEGVDGYDVYNPSVPFELDNMIIMAGRVECRESEMSSTMFFTLNNGIWQLIEDAPVFDNLQDPFITFIGGELVLGGVNVIWEDDQTVSSWQTDFYKGKSIYSLEKFLSGPKHMKDIRLLEMDDSSIAVFSRPQGEYMLNKYNCIAKIGFTIVESLDKITTKIIANAPLLHDHFLLDEWGGCNQLFMLKNGLIGVLGHKSRGEDIDDILNLHYYSISFAINPITRKMTPVKMIACRDMFPQGDTKHPRLQDVTFTAGIIRNNDGTANLYTGLSDCQVGKIVINDPLAEYETIKLC